MSPEYPQCARATYESTRREAERVARKTHPDARLAFVPPFFNQEGFLAATSALLADFDRAERPEHYLFSFHGLPVRHLRKTGGKHCYRSSGCCDGLREVNRNCYRAQSFWTAREMARRVGLAEGDFGVGFQSRMGRSRWIEPYSDRLLAELAGRGVRRLAVACPSFAADCLETLEEVGIRYRRKFESWGGELLLAPCLNACVPWVDALADMIRGASRG